ncbi:MAG: lipid-A-disaccharide synthase [Verrucomicrobiota bacterium]|nr:lipid-A-disaccharide synthase [Verrucomicrobiota bacterium]
MSKHLYFVAGEASGDEHGAALMLALRELDAQVRFSGRGGPKMHAIAGGAFRNWSESAAVVGLWEVVRRYGYFREEFAATLDEIAAAKPDGIVLIDYPGFNLRLARALRRRNFAGKIIYYISPQVWAWNRARIPRMARSLDLMLCIFPFEAELYNQSGLRTIFVGHPMLQNLATAHDELTRDENLVGLFPGSRLREVRKILPILQSAAQLMIGARPQLRFEVAAASESLATEIRAILAETDNFIVTVGQATDLMRRAAVGAVASGTATLEAAFFRMPFVLVYKVSWLTYAAARLVVKVKFLGMPNVLAGREIVPELIQHHAHPRAIADALLTLLCDATVRSKMLVDLQTAIGTLGDTPASASAARAVLDELST